jgi:predicted nucleic acid-binding protein
VIDVGGYGLVLAATPADVAPWLRPVIEAGRDAAFVDTSYIRALLDDRDDRHAAVDAFHNGLSASLYTSALVVAEAARQFAKAERVGQDWRWQRVEQLTAILATEEQMVICAPPETVIRDALAVLNDMQRVLLRLDLCDLVSMLALEALNHRRVLGFDDHFRAVGASLEP